MQIQSIYMENFKNIKQATIELKNKTIGIYGPNGSGKTSVAEAIHLLKTYIVIGENKSTDYVKSYFHAQSKMMKLAIVFADGDELIKYELEFENSDGIVQVVNERMSVKADNPRTKFQQLIHMDNSSDQVQPVIMVKEARKYQKMNYEKKTYIQFMHFNSFLSLLSTDENSHLFGFQKFAKIQRTFTNIVVSMLEDNAIAQLQLILPMQIHADGISDVFPLVLNGGYHARVQVEALKTVIQEVDELFQAIFPERNLSLQENDVRQDLNGEQVSITLFVERDGIKLPIHAESTGTIKLIGLLSALVAYVKYEEFILVVDELDAHIYEYLLAVLLEQLSLVAKGQLIFTAHNLAPLERLGKNSIIFTNETVNGVTFEYLKNVKKTTNIRDKYLRAIAYSTEDNIELSGMNESALQMIVESL